MVSTDQKYSIFDNTGVKERIARIGYRGGNVDVQNASIEELQSLPTELLSELKKKTGSKKTPCLPLFV